METTQVQRCHLHKREIVIPSARFQREESADSRRRKNAEPRFDSAQCRDDNAEKCHGLVRTSQALNTSTLRVLMILTRSPLPASAFLQPQLSADSALGEPRSQFPPAETA
jgi:hypothetical protein